MIETEQAGANRKPTQWCMQIAGTLILLAALTGCNGKGIQDAPQDINVSPRSQEAYDPLYRQMENDPVESKKRQQQQQ